MENPTFATRWNIDEVENNYLLWLKNPSSLDSKWQCFFEGFHLGSDNGQATPHSHGQKIEKDDDSIEKHARLYGAIYAFRDIGHTQATFDPLRGEIAENPRLSMERLGFGPNDLSEVHFSGNYLGGVRMSIGEIFDLSLIHI